jgi:hypothetical protein
MELQATQNLQSTPASGFHYIILRHKLSQSWAVRPSRFATSRPAETPLPAPCPTFKPSHLLLFTLYALTTSACRRHLADRTPTARVTGPTAFPLSPIGRRPLGPIRANPRQSVAKLSFLLLSSRTATSRSIDIDQLPLNARQKPTLCGCMATPRTLCPRIATGLSERTSRKQIHLRPKRILQRAFQPHEIREPRPRSKLHQKIPIAVRVSFTPAPARQRAKPASHRTPATAAAKPPRKRQLFRAR